MHFNQVKKKKEIQQHIRGSGEKCNRKGNSLCWKTESSAPCHCVNMNILMKLKMVKLLLSVDLCNSVFSKPGNRWCTT